MIKSNLFFPLCLLAVLIFLTLPAHAANRVRAGQWEVTINLMGHEVTRSKCFSQSEADALNGDAASIKAYVEHEISPAGCHVKDVKISGDVVSVTSVCSGKTDIGKTIYHGDSFESENTNGAKSHAKWVGVCK